MAQQFEGSLPAPQGHIFDGGTLALWRFDDAAGTLIAEYSGRTPLTAVNSPDVVESILSGARNFNGTNQYAWAPGTPEALSALNDGLTVESWITLDMNWSGAGTIVGYVGNGQAAYGTPTHRQAFLLRVAEDRRVLFQYHGNNPADNSLVEYQIETPAGLVEKNRRTHIAARKRKDGPNWVIEIFVNSILSAQGNCTHGFAGGVSSQWAVGYNPDPNPSFGTPADYFKGRIDDTRISNMVRADSEIVQSYRRGLMNAGPAVTFGEGGGQRPGVIGQQYQFQLVNGQMWTIDSAGSRFDNYDGTNILRLYNRGYVEASKYKLTSGQTWETLPSAGESIFRDEEGNTLLGLRKDMLAFGSKLTALASKDLLNATITQNTTTIPVSPADFPSEDNDSFAAGILQDERLVVVGGQGLDLGVLTFGTGWTLYRLPTTGPSLLENSWGIFSVLSNDNVLVTGAYHNWVDDLKPDDVYEFNTTSNTYVKQTCVLSPWRTNAQACRMLDGRVLLTGGIDAVYTADYKNTASIYDPVAKTMVNVAPMHDARIKHESVLLPDGRVMVMGGHNGYTDGLDSDIPMAECEAYDPVSGAWTQLAPMITPRKRFRATLLQDGRVIVVSGCNISVGGSGDRTPQCEIYDPAINKWTAIANINLARAETALGVLGEYVVAAGGRGGPDRAEHSIEVYSIAQNKWGVVDIAGSGDPAFTKAGIVKRGSELLVVGGYDAMIHGGLVLTNPGLSPTETYIKRLDLEHGAFILNGDDDNSVYERPLLTIQNRIMPTTLNAILLKKTAASSPTLAVDWDGNVRAATLTLLDGLMLQNAATNAVISINGRYMQWYDTGELNLNNGTLAGVVSISATGATIGGTTLDTDIVSTGSLTLTGSATASSLSAGSMTLSGDASLKGIAGTYSGSVDPDYDTWLQGFGGTDYVMSVVTGDYFGSRYSVLAGGLCNRPDLATPRISASGMSYSPDTSALSGGYVNLSTGLHATLHALTPPYVVSVGGISPDTGTPTGTIRTTKLDDSSFANNATPLITARYRHQSVKLSNGKILVVGGVDSNGDALASCELFDPSNGNVSATGSMTFARRLHQLVHLEEEGLVLAVGGTSEGGTSDIGSALDPMLFIKNIEVYDLQTGIWTDAANVSGITVGRSLVMARVNHKIILQKVYSSGPTKYRMFHVLGGYQTRTGTDGGYFADEDLDIQVRITDSSLAVINPSISSSGGLRPDDMTLFDYKSRIQTEYVPFDNFSIEKVSETQLNADGQGGSISKYLIAGGQQDLGGGQRRVLSTVMLLTVNSLSSYTGQVKTWAAIGQLASPCVQPGIVPSLYLNGGANTTLRYAIAGGYTANRYDASTTLRGWASAVAAYDATTSYTSRRLSIDGPDTAIYGKSVGVLDGSVRIIGATGAQADAPVLEVFSDTANTGSFADVASIDRNGKARFGSVEIGESQDPITAQQETKTTIDSTGRITTVRGASTDALDPSEGTSDPMVSGSVFVPHNNYKTTNILRFDHAGTGNPANFGILYPGAELQYTGKSTLLKDKGYSKPVVPSTVTMGYAELNYGGKPCLLPDGRVVLVGGIDHKESTIWRTNKKMWLFDKNGYGTDGGYWMPRGSTYNGTALFGSNAYHNGAIHAFDNGNVLMVVARELTGNNTVPSVQLWTNEDSEAGNVTFPSPAENSYIVSAKHVDDKVYIMYLGTNNSTDLRFMSVADDGTTDTGLSTPSSPTALEASLGNAVLLSFPGRADELWYIVLGGAGQSSPVLKYVISTDTWTRETTGPNDINPSAGLGNGAVVDTDRNQAIFITGNLTGGPSTEVHTFDPATVTWSTPTGMLDNRANPAMVYLPNAGEAGVLFVVGSIAPGGPLGTSEYYDFDTDTWTASTTTELRTIPRMVALQDGSSALLLGAHFHDAAFIDPQFSRLFDFKVPTGFQIKSTNASDNDRVYWKISN